MVTKNHGFLSHFSSSLLWPTVMKYSVVVLWGFNGFSLDELTKPIIMNLLKMSLEFCSYPLSLVLIKKRLNTTIPNTILHNEGEFKNPHTE